MVLFSVVQAAVEAGLDPRTLRRLIRRGQVTPTYWRGKRGRFPLFATDEIDAIAKKYAEQRPRMELTPAGE